MTSKEEQEAIDAVLDAALDELDDEDNEKKEPQDTQEDTAADSKPTAKDPPLSSGASPSPKSPPITGPPRPPSNEENMFADMMQAMLQIEEQGGDTDAASDEFVGQLMKNMQSQLSAELEKVEGTTNQGAESSSPQSSEIPNTSENSVNEAISSLLEGMAKDKTMDETAAGPPPSGVSDEDMLKSLMEGLRGAEGDFNADALLDGMMEQLLSKDLMYEPIQQFATKFPPWLEERRDTMSDGEYATRQKQCECFKQIVHVYETEPNNTSKIMVLMQENQEYGELPVEFTKEVAPGLEFDANGMPKLSPDGSNEECRVM